MKRILFLATQLVLMFSILSCSKDDNDSKTPKTLLVGINSTYVESLHSFTSNSSLKLEYDKDHKLVKLSSIYSSSGTSNNISTLENTYYYDKNSRLSGMNSFRNNTDSNIENERDSSNVVYNSEGKISKVNFFTEENNVFTPQKTLEYKWSNGKVVEIKNVVENKTYAISYLYGNIANLQQDYYSGGTVSYTATFDDKKTPYSLLTDVLLLGSSSLDNFIEMPESDDDLSTLNNNNITKSTLVLQKDGGNTLLKESEYTYEYNADGYPVKVIHKGKYSVSTTTYTYEKR